MGGIKLRFVRVCPRDGEAGRADAVAELRLGVFRDVALELFPVVAVGADAFAVAADRNQPLQLLIDAGWPAFAMVVVAGGVVVWTLLRRGRRDAIEGALVAGLAAVLAHSLVDFGLETLGVALPFMAVLGTTLGRMGPVDGSAPAPSRAPAAVAFGAIAALVVGVAATAHAGNRDMDLMLKRVPAQERRALLLEAQRAHPTDYFYALSFAQLEPLKAMPGTPSPRMHALNRALTLCPNCESVHAEIATNLWRLGLRSQALLEWRSAVDAQPSWLPMVLGKLFAAGAKPTELAAVAANDRGRMVEVANFLSSRSRVADAILVLDQADAMGQVGYESKLARGNLQLLSGQHAAALATVTALRAAGVQDAQLSVLESKAILASKGAQGVDEALRVIETAAARFPTEIAIPREWVRLVIAYEKWQSAPRAVEALKRALYALHGRLGEAHIVDARINARLGHWNAALSEYRLALADEGNDVGLWVEFGRTAESAGRVTVAREAYQQASRLSPNSPDVAQILRQLEDRQHSLRTLLQE